ncbi:MAG: hypothetical protein U9Q08_03280 [Candidatus Omnitrophota bacterium]|nr:hypothetical protein [Candidatus Omnitrophota bacterium]
MEKDELNQRKEDILTIVIQFYITTGTPVASRLISDTYNLSLSPATIRNEMSELEEMGYLGHPYTSAGRIPTDQGYRYYVDRLMRVKDMTKKEINRIEKQYIDHQNGLEEIAVLEETITGISQALSELTNYTAVSLFPGFKDCRAGHEKRLYLEGIWHILNYPEFHDFDVIKRMFETFEKKYQILDVLNEDIEQEGIQIHIGSENKYCELQNCSLVTSRYSKGDQVIGSLGIIGPVRMDYERVVGMVGFLAEVMTGILS